MSCLNPVGNAVIARNTVYMDAVLDRLKAEGERVAHEDLVHFSPARCNHIDPLGVTCSRSTMRPGEDPLRPFEVASIR